MLHWTWTLRASNHDQYFQYNHLIMWVLTSEFDTGIAVKKYEGETVRVKPIIHLYQLKLIHYSLHYILHMTCQYMYNIYESVMLWHDIDLSMTEAEINLLHLILMMHLCHSCNTNRFSRYYDIIRVHVCTLYRAHFLFNLVPNPRGGESNVIIFSTL